jgi:acetyl-CoA synthetase
MERFRLTTFCAPPTVYRFLVKEDLAKYDFRTIHQWLHCRRAPESGSLPPMAEEDCLRLVEGFGQTEGSVLIANFPWMDVKPGSTGRFFPGLLTWRTWTSRGGRARTALSARWWCGRPATSGRRSVFGSISVTRKPWPPAGGRRLQHRDMAWRDEDGYIWFVGRDDDVIKTQATGSGRLKS